MTSTDKDTIKLLINLIKPNEPNLQKRLITCNIALKEAFLCTVFNEVEKPTSYTTIIKVSQNPFNLHVTKNNGFITNIQLSKVEIQEPIDFIKTTIHSN